MTARTVKTGDGKRHMPGRDLRPAEFCRECWWQTPAVATVQPCGEHDGDPPDPKTYLVIARSRTKGGKPSGVNWWAHQDLSEVWRAVDNLDGYCWMNIEDERIKFKGVGM